MQSRLISLILVITLIISFTVVSQAQSGSNPFETGNSTKCSFCKGTGQISQPAERTICIECKGRGKIRVFDCPWCNGKGFNEKPERSEPCGHCIKSGTIYDEIVVLKDRMPTYPFVKAQNSGGVEVIWITVTLQPYDPGQVGPFRQLYYELKLQNLAGSENGTVSKKALTLPRPSSVIIPAANGHPNEFEHELDSYSGFVVTTQFLDGTSDDGISYNSITARIRIKYGE